MVIALMAITMLPVSSANATDFIAEIDSTVVLLHEYSVMSGTFKPTMKEAEMRNLISNLNSNLESIRKGIVIYDADLAKNWKFLIDNDNYNYPHKQLLKSYDLEIFDWYSYQRKLNLDQVKCLSKKVGATKCVIQTRANAKSGELKRYQALTETLNSIQAWRKTYKR
jgi:hypothetical protein